MEAYSQPLLGTSVLNNRCNECLALRHTVQALKKQLDRQESTVQDCVRRCANAELNQSNLQKWSEKVTKKINTLQVKEAGMQPLQEHFGTWLCSATSDAAVKDPDSD